jgi:protein-S-isoprenylcysteine O-methyltransferase Ste14
MSFWSLQYFVGAVVVIVLLRHVQGAAVAFSRVAGQRPSPLLQSFIFADIVVVYKAFNARPDPRLAVPGLVAFAGSFLLFEWARRTIRGKFFSYAYTDDTPQFLLTSGPYAYIRNPFYASYLLAYLGAAILFPGLATLVVFLGMDIFLLMVARFEEQKFVRSPLAAQYAAYRRRTGMFIPKLVSAEKP